MKIVSVFGGSGFLGSHVADQLSIAGYKVRVIDLAPSPWLRDDQEMVIANVKNRNDVERAVEGSDIVFNFAALADLNEGLNNPIETIETNILGNAFIMEACLKYGVERFVYASTIYVFSREGGFYRCSKQSSEHYIEEYSKRYGLNYTILRYGSLYGPRSDKSNGLYRIVKNAINTGRITYKGSEDSLREYIHVEDASIASIELLAKDYKNQSIVLTGQEPMRVFEMLEMLREILDLKEDVNFLNEEQLGHYIRTPYSYQPKLGRKYIPSCHVDLGQGLLQLVHDVKQEN